MEIKQKLGLALSLMLLVFPSIAFAHQPVLESSGQNPIVGQSVNSGLYFSAEKIADPTKTSLALYGNLAEPGEVDLFVFVPEQKSSIPVELLVPVRPANEKFKPSVYLIAKNIEGNTETVIPKFPFTLPEGYKVKELSNKHENGIFNEPFSQERYYHGTEEKIYVEPKQNYFLAVVEPNSQIGDYTLGVGTVENFENANFGTLLKNVLLLKLGLVGDVEVPWLDFVGLFIVIAGLIIGLGAVTVIDVHGLFARHSNYWTESTIRAHKVTKPLIWVGIGLFILGSVIIYRQSYLTGVAFYQLILTILLILNGLFLTFYVSPRLLKQEQEGKITEILPQSLQNKITISFLISFIGWWGNVFFLVWYLLMMN